MKITDAGIERAKSYIAAWAPDYVRDYIDQIEKAALASVPSVPVGHYLAWIQVNKLFQKHGLLVPPVRLRDELVSMTMDSVRADTIRECADHLAKEMHKDDGDDWAARFAYNSLLEGYGCFRSAQIQDRPSPRNNRGAGMTRDLPERLDELAVRMSYTDASYMFGETHPVIREAAARIRELEGEVDKLVAETHGLGNEADAMTERATTAEAENAALREALERLVNPWKGTSQKMPPWAIGIAKAALSEGSKS